MDPLMSLLLLVLILLITFLLLALRLLLILPHGNGAPAPDRPSASLGVFLGSGGHTAEMRALLGGASLEKYHRRVYVYGARDEMSLRTIVDLEEKSKETSPESSFEILALPRARRVGEGKVSTVFSASKTFLFAWVHCFLLPFIKSPGTPWVDVLVLNGPGTGVVLVLVLYIRRILGMSYTRIIYVESFARVKSLSLSGKLLRPFVDKFVVQWLEAAGPLGIEIKSERNSASSSLPPVTRGVTYRGWLV